MFFVAAAACWKPVRSLSKCMLRRIPKAKCKQRSFARRYLVATAVPPRVCTLCRVACADTLSCGKHPCVSAAWRPLSAAWRPLQQLRRLTSRSARYDRNDQTDALGVHTLCCAVHAATPRQLCSCKSITLPLIPDNSEYRMGQVPRRTSALRVHM